MKSQRTDTGKYFPLSTAQQAIWLGHQFDPGNAAYNVASYLDIPALLNHQQLEQALQQTVAETDVLRTKLVEDEQSETTFQAVLEHVPSPIELFDFRHDPMAKDKALASMRSAVAQAIDLKQGPLFVSHLYLISEQRSFWFFKSHHIALDGFGMTMVTKRVADLYTALAQGQPFPAPVFLPLESLLESEKAYEASADMQKDGEYWRRNCHDLDEVVSFQEHTAAPSATSIFYETQIPATTLAELQKSMTGKGSHWTHGLIAAFGAFLARFSGHRSVVLGIPFFNRLNSTTTRVPATCANVLPLCLDVQAHKTVASLMDQVANAMNEMRKHQRYRAENLRRELQLVGEGRRLTGPQINIGVFASEILFAGYASRTEILSAGPADDFSVMINPYTQTGELLLQGVANPAVYSEQDLEHIVRQFLAFIQDFTADVNQPLGRLSVGRSEALRHSIRNPLRPSLVQDPGSDTLTARFEAKVKEQPSAIALRYQGESVSYEELNQRANQLAHEMLEIYQVPARTLVALLLPRTPEMLATLLAVLKCGAAYLPIDPDSPGERIASILNDTKPSLLITHSSVAQNFTNTVCATLHLDQAENLSRRPIQNVSEIPGRYPAPEDLAYVIYTSGSTGKPKGVKISHFNVLRLFNVTDSWFHYRSDDTWTMCHSYVFDASVWEMWGALLHGGRLLIVPPDVARAPDLLLQLIVAEKVTVFGQIPSAFYRFMEAEQDRPDLGEKLSLRYQCFGGEALDLNRLKPWFERHPDKPALINMYGITETTINTTHQFITRTLVAEQKGSMIGKVYDDLGIRVLDDALQPVAVGGIGEMYITGAGLAEGYLNRPELDAVRFVADPFGQPGDRMYRSGDVARLHADAQLEYIGRADQQVKIRGYRIELGEIEAALRKHPHISDAVAIVRSDSKGDRSIVAHIVPTGEHSVEDFDLNTIRNYLREILPAYMIPSAMGVLAALPFNQNGKVDRRALPEIKSTVERHVEPARDASDEEVLHVWRRYVDCETLGIDDNFFDMGGDSFKAIRVCRDLSIPVMQLFNTPTPRAIADFLRGQQDEEERGEIHYLQTFPGTLNSANGPHLIMAPFGGGNALAFRELAQRLDGDFHCCALQIPGHDPGKDEAFEPITAVAEKTALEIKTRLKGPLVIYGHCAGNALALLLASELEKLGLDLKAVVIGAMLPDPDPQAVLTQVKAQDSAGFIDFLRSIGGFKEVLDDVSLQKIGSMIKHDAMEAATMFAHIAPEKLALSVPLHCVVGDQDPLTPDYQERFRHWDKYSSIKSLSVVTGGGHYFVSENASELANIVRQQLSGLLKSPKSEVRKNLRPFFNPFDDQGGSYRLLINQLGQSSIWPDFVPVPTGWSVAFGPADHGSCLKAAQEQGERHGR